MAFYFLFHSHRNNLGEFCERLIARKNFEVSPLPAGMDAVNTGSLSAGERESCSVLFVFLFHFGCFFTFVISIYSFLLFSPLSPPFFRFNCLCLCFHLFTNFSFSFSSLPIYLYVLAYPYCFFSLCIPLLWSIDISLPQSSGHNQFIKSNKNHSSTPNVQNKHPNRQPNKQTNAQTYKILCVLLACSTYSGQKGHSWFGFSPSCPLFLPADSACAEDASARTWRRTWLRSTAKRERKKDVVVRIHFVLFDWVLEVMRVYMYIS